MFLSEGNCRSESACICSALEHCSWQNSWVVWQYAEYHSCVWLSRCHGKTQVTTHVNGVASLLAKCRGSTRVHGFAGGSHSSSCGRRSNGSGQCVRAGGSYPGRRAGPVLHSCGHAGAAGQRGERLPPWPGHFRRTSSAGKHLLLQAVVNHHVYAAASHSCMHF